MKYRWWKLHSHLAGETVIILYTALYFTQNFRTYLNLEMDNFEGIIQNAEYKTRAI